MTSADSYRMGGIEDEGTVVLEYVSRLLTMGVILCKCLCVDLLEVGNVYGSRMGYHGNMLLKTSAGAGEADMEGLI